MQRDKIKIESSLQSKGFQKEKKDHRVFIYYTINGERTLVKTKTSHGNRKYKSIGNTLLGKMAKQCKLNFGQFIDLIDCPLNRNEYEDLLRNNDVL